MSKNAEDNSADTPYLTVKLPKCSLIDEGTKIKIIHRDGTIEIHSTFLDLEAAREAMRNPGGIKDSVLSNLEYPTILTNYPGGIGEFLERNSLFLDVYMP